MASLSKASPLFIYKTDPCSLISDPCKLGSKAAQFAHEDRIKIFWKTVQLAAKHSNTVTWKTLQHTLTPAKSRKTGSTGKLEV